MLMQALQVELHHLLQMQQQAQAQQELLQVQLPQAWAPVTALALQHQRGQAWGEPSSPRPR